MPISEAQRAENEEWHRKLVDNMELGYPWRAVPDRGVWYLMTSNRQNLARFNLDSGHASRLAAAAPDLLAAVKMLLGDWADDDTMDHMPGVKEARAAIAKATDPHLPQ